MRFRNIILILVLIIISGSGCISSSDQNDLNWSTDLNMALQEAQKTNKTIIIDFYASWCGSCNQMEKDTFSNSQVQQKLNDYILVKVNIDQNPNLVQQYKIYSVPTLVFLDPNGMEIKRLNGYQSPQKLLNQI